LGGENPFAFTETGATMLKYLGGEDTFAFIETGATMLSISDT
jgi:hypothetical protein